MPRRSAGRQRDVIGQRLKPVLSVVLVMFALLCVNALYLASISMLEFVSGRLLQDNFYQYMFLVHVVLGLVFVVPAVIYSVGHYRRAYRRPNRRAVRAGQGIALCGALLLISGLALTRGLPGVTLNDGQVRLIMYWVHVVAPLLVVWLFVLHRLAGQRLRWRAGGVVLASAAVLSVTGVLAIWQAKDPSLAQTSETYFAPSLARTANAQLIPAEMLMTDDYCAQCHGDIHAQWEFSAHHLASFNNPAYAFSVRQTRSKMLARDGSVQGARFCAGCHDPVPFFSGAFNNPDFDDVADPTSQAGITCVSCHAIEHINSPRGNADYVIGPPVYYPFTFSDSPLLQWANRFLIEANPSFHKRSFLKPLHTSSEFCGTCHKVHLPKELNNYRWLRGQNHYDAFLLSGVSGASVSSFYYPPKAQENCNGCHMSAVPSDDPTATTVSGHEGPSVPDHLFAAGNTALGSLLDHPPEVLEKHRAMLEGAVSIDIFGLREETVDGGQIAPLSEYDAPLKRGADYLLEVVLTTRTLGHLFTQGTADSNQIWLEVSILHEGQPVAVSGAINAQGEVDPGAHFVNAFVIDREGQRIDQRNAEDIFTTLYNHQIPPGAADVVFYRFSVPPQWDGKIEFKARLRYRKFDSTFYRLFSNQADAQNPLPIVDISSATSHRPSSEDPLWRRWNDYGIGLLRKPESGALRQAEAAFNVVSEMPAPGNSHGLINLARAYLREGRLQDAEAALTRAANTDLPYPWVHGWLTAELNLQNGFIEEAAEGLATLLETPFAAARQSGFDFSRDYRLQEQLAGAYYDLSRLPSAPSQRAGALGLAKLAYQQVLAAEPERASAHYGLSRVFEALDDSQAAQRHAEAHERYRVDDSARDIAITRARAKYPFAAVAAEPVPVYPLKMIQTPGDEGR
ncbi:MAG: multiheme c-type cytochrome [Lysobacterales bacterium]